MLSVRIRFVFPFVDCMFVYVLQVDTQTFKTSIFKGGNVIQTNYYIHSKHAPPSWFIYECCGEVFYDKIVNSVNDLALWFHKYHKCKTCGACHKCPKCNTCFIYTPGSHKQCLNCHYQMKSGFNDELPMWDAHQTKRWRYSINVFINNQHLLNMGITTYHNIFQDKQLKKVECDAQAMLNDNFTDCTIEKLKGKIKCCFGARYVWLKDDQKNSRWMHAGSIRTDVAPIPKCVCVEVTMPLEQIGLIESNSVNAASLNAYQKGNGSLETHFDGKHKFNLFNNILILRLLADAALRFECKERWGKNALLKILLKRGIICELKPTTYGSDWIKHCLPAIDFSDNNAALILRRVYPFLLLWSKQRDNNF